MNDVQKDKMLKYGSLFYVLWALLLSCYLEFAASQATSHIQTLVGWNASFNFQLDADVNDSTVFIRNKDQVLLMNVKGNAVVYEAEYKNRTEFTGNLSTRQISFTLRNVTLRDAGLYTAKTSQFPGPYGEQTLIVKASPSKPQIVEVATPVSGLKSVFKCSTQSNSAPVNHGLIMMSEWKFRRNNQLINPGSRYSMAETNLIIAGTSYEEDNDVRLTCVAYEDLNAKSEKSDEFLINVKYGPHNVHITGDPVVNEGEKLTLNCSGDCNPPCINHQWCKGSQPIGSLSSLVIDNISRGNAGVYTCTVNNSAISNSSASQITVTVKYPPVLTMRATNTSKGGRLVINCTASGVPNKYKFFKWTQMAPDENRTIVSELEPALLSDSEVSVTINGVTYQDSGFYVCKASNGITNNSTGQSIMQNMVFAWITDQPRITSNARVFDAKKGTSGQMHIEFYSGVIQPAVTWYRVKNFAMEPLQNPQDYKISLSAQTVEIQYHQKTVRLSGYNASLEVVTVGEEHFTSYKVEISNSYGEPVNETLELKPRGPPETPTNFNVVPESVTTHSLQLAWQAGFHGGAIQTFVIEYRETGETTWLNKSKLLGLVQHVTLNTTITDLKAGTNYEFRIFSVNVFNRSQTSPTINETTVTVKKDVAKQDGSSVVIGAATGSALVLIIAVAVICVLFYKRRKSIKSPEKAVLQEAKNISNRHGSVGLVDNLAYDDSGPLPDPSTIGDATGVQYATVVKPKKKTGQVEDPSRLYGVVDKTHKRNKGQVKEKHGKAPRDDTYENAAIVEKQSVHSNSGDLKTDENVYENPNGETPKGILAKKDGLLYADLMLDAAPTKNVKSVIRGLENHTEYAEIAYGKKGEPLLDGKKE